MHYGIQEKNHRHLTVIDSICWLICVAPPCCTWCWFKALSNFEVHYVAKSAWQHTLKPYFKVLWNQGPALYFMLLSGVKVLFLICFVVILGACLFPHGPTLTYHKTWSSDCLFLLVAQSPGFSQAAAQYMIAWSGKQVKIYALSSKIIFDTASTPIRWFVLWEVLVLACFYISVQFCSCRTPQTPASEDQNSSTINKPRRSHLVLWYYVNSEVCTNPCIHSVSIF